MSACRTWTSSERPWSDKSKLRTVTADYIKKLKIKAYNADMAGEELSGGNQQKVVIAKWLLSQADVYIFDEPTRGHRRRRPG